MLHLHVISAGFGGWVMSAGTATATNLTRAAVAAAAAEQLRYVGPKSPPASGEAAEATGPGHSGELNLSNLI